MKKSYLPLNDKERAVWFKNFSVKLAPLATSLGLSASDVTAINNDSAYFSYCVDTAEMYKAEASERNRYKNILRDGPIGSSLGPYPSTPTIPTPPTVVQAGVFARLRLIVQRIKNHTNYTEAIGMDLGIIGAEDIWNPDDLKPVLKLAIKGGHVEVQWTKGHADAICIEKLVGTATAFSFLAINLKPNFIDRTPITEAAVWKYRAIYILNDEPVGHYSDICQIAVGSAI